MRRLHGDSQDAIPRLRCWAAALSVRRPTTNREVRSSAGAAASSGDGSEADRPTIELHAALNPERDAATCHPVPPPMGIVALATRARRPDRREAPLASGLVDRLAEGGLRAFGPTAAAARVEASKRFAKELMLGAGIPTARATWHRDVGSARAAARALGAPVVIKASGLASGKGVAVCDTAGAADAAIDDMLQEHRYGASGDEVLVEEFMESEELSVFALTDGTDSWARRRTTSGC